jgi:DNA-binding transcriptional regulator LsrR (DeoR family)
VRIVEEEVIYFRNVWCYDDARIAKKLGMKEDTLRRYIEIAEKEGVLAA